jgi:amidase
MVPMANASDSGGSIRVPASCCGVFGMKPTRSRISPSRRAQGVSMRVALISENSVTISVRDSAALLDATHGPLPGDPYIAPAPARPYLDEIGADPGRLRVAFSRVSPTGADLHPDCVAAVEDAAALLERLGHHVEEAVMRLDVEQVKTPFLTISSAGIAWDIRNWERVTGKQARQEDFEANTWTMIERGRAANTTAEQLMDALVGMQQITDDIATFFQPYDVWLTPTVGTPPPPLGSFTASADDPMRGIRNASSFLPFTTLANISGRPAMSLPLYWNAEDVPIGVHVVGQYGDEGMLFRLAAQLEEARPWADRRPKAHLVEVAS